MKVEQIKGAGFCVNSQEEMSTTAQWHTPAEYALTALANEGFKQKSGERKGKLSTRSRGKGPAFPAGPNSPMGFICAWNK
jgi:hypothetical protein